MNNHFILKRTYMSVWQATGRRHICPYGSKRVKENKNKSKFLFKGHICP